MVIINDAQTTWYSHFCAINITLISRNIHKAIAASPTAAGPMFGDILKDILLVNK